MPDVFTKSKRSYVMSRIRSRGNKDTEVVLAKLLRRHKISGWRRHVRVVVEGRKPRVERQINSRPRLSSPAARLTVRPDFVFPVLKFALFVDGCFWHRCPRHGTQPKGNAAFWRKKFSGNQQRDKLVTRTLRRAGWRVLRIWEHELARRHEARLVNKILGALKTWQGFQARRPTNRHGMSVVEPA